jgi:hypothetical protein
VLRSGNTVFHASRTSAGSRDIPMCLLAQEAMKEAVSTSGLDPQDIGRSIPGAKSYPSRYLH